VTNALLRKKKVIWRSDRGRGKGRGQSLVTERHREERKSALLEKRENTLFQEKMQGIGIRVPTSSEHTKELRMKCVKEVVATEGGGERMGLKATTRDPEKPQGGPRAGLKFEGGVGRSN